MFDQLEALSILMKRNGDYNKKRISGKFVIREYELELLELRKKSSGTTMRDT